jgi:hypothetical protein
MPQQSIAWFESGPAFEVLSPGFSRPDATETPPEGGTQNIHIIARYPSDPSKILLSGWALGAEKIAGKAALVQINMGKARSSSSASAAIPRPEPGDVSVVI